jgi:photosystem II stability/assembly factor-like uncharacterized protein
MRALVSTALGLVAVDIDDGEVELVDEPAELPPVSAPEISLPLLVTAAEHGSTAVAVVDRRPPLLVSNDGGITWRETGAGLPPGRAVAISPDDPDLILFAGEERLFLSRDGGRFWQALAVELAGITAVALVDE